MGLKQHMRLGTSVGVGIVIVGVLLVVSGALGVVTYNTMDAPVGDTPEEKQQNQQRADGIKTSFIVWMVIGVAFLMTYFGFIAYESGIVETRRALCPGVSGSRFQEICQTPVKSAKDYAVAVVILTYVVNVLLITTSSQGIALHNLIGTYKGGDPKEMESNQQTSQNIYGTNIAFLVISVIFFVMYTLYLAEAPKYGKQAFQSWQERRSVVPDSSVEMTGLSGGMGDVANESISAFFDY
ncbi:MAG: hypothetical protein K0U52_07395 [Gammaproteobacteria bacterium]|nr:hypothetical protein [Gammaproteobacteria bacterium]